MKNLIHLFLRIAAAVAFPLWLYQVVVMGFALLGKCDWPESNHFLVFCMFLIGTMSSIIYAVTGDI